MKYALVTGASSGIGKSISYELARRGYSIVAVSDQEDALNELAKDLAERFNVSVEVLCTDLSLSYAADSVYKFTSEKSLNVSVLINNAGILVAKEAMKVEVEDVKTILQLHMVTTTLLCRLYGKDMVEKGSGHILNVSSVAAYMPYPVISYYGPTKSYLKNFSRALRSELKPSGVSVTCLMPGAVHTHLYKDYDVNIPLARRLKVMRTADSIARAGVNAMFRNRSIKIPGIMNKLAAVFVPMIPSFIIIGIFKRWKKRQDQ